LWVIWEISFHTVGTNCKVHSSFAYQKSNSLSWNSPGQQRPSRVHSDPLQTFVPCSTKMRISLRFSCGSFAWGFETKILYTLLISCLRATFFSRRYEGMSTNGEASRYVIFHITSPVLGRRIFWLLTYNLRKPLLIATRSIQHTLLDILDDKVEVKLALCLTKYQAMKMLSCT
jgi:hypothetical protein